MIKNKLNKIISLILMAVLVLSITGCQMSGVSSRPAKIEDVQTLLSEIQSLESFTARLSVGIEAESSLEASEVGIKLIELADIDTDGLSNFIDYAEISNNTLLTCDIKVNKAEEQAEVTVSAGDTTIPIIYDKDCGYIETKAFMTLLGIDASDSDLTAEEKAMLELIFGRYKYIKANDVSIEDIAEITNINKDSDNFDSESRVQLSKYRDKERGLETVYTVQASKDKVKQLLDKAGLADDMVLTGKNINVKMYVEKQEKEAESTLYTVRIVVSADNTSFITSLKIKDITPSIKIPSSNEVMDPENMIGGSDSGFNFNQSDTEHGSIESNIDNTQSKIGEFNHQGDGYIAYKGEIKLSNNEITDTIEKVEDFENNLTRDTINQYKSKVTKVLETTGFTDIVDSYKDEKETYTFINAYSHNEIDSKIEIYITDNKYGSVKYHSIIEDEQGIEKSIQEVKNIIGVELGVDTVENLINECKESNRQSFSVYLDDYNNGLSVYVSYYDYGDEREEYFFTVARTIEK